MAEPHWPESVDDVVERTRFTDNGDSWWTTASKTVAAGLPKEQLEYLATLGLTELVTWSHRLNRTGGYPCAGQQIAYERFADHLEPLEYPDGERPISEHGR